MFKIGNFDLSISPKTLVIAELSANHNQNFDIAVKTIYAAKEAGADAVKLQTYTADTITLDCDNEYFQIKQGTLWDGTTLHKLYQEAFTPWEWQPKLKQIAEEVGLICFSSPFDKSSVDFLESMDVPAYKIASFEITDIPLIEYTASKGKPIIISTGIASLSDIKDAIEACHKVGNFNICLLKCTSAYPASIDEANLLTMVDLKKRFSTLVGLSDHTMGSDVSIAAVALGASIVEKHFILDRNIGGPDSSFSMEPQEFKDMVNSIRNVEMALGQITYELSEKSKKNRHFARSIFAVKDIKKGEVFSEANIRSIRPGDGISPKYLPSILGKKALCDIIQGTPINEKHFN